MDLTSTGTSKGPQLISSSNVKMHDHSAKSRYLDASALVKLVVDEGDSLPVREFFQNNTNFCATSLCVAEALGVLKAKWNRHQLSEDQYHIAASRLIIDAWGKRIEIDNIDIFTPIGLKAVEATAKKHALDLSDALQLETILRGKFSVLIRDSSSVLITADKKLATAANKEGIRVWNCIEVPAPAWT